MRYSTVFTLKLQQWVTWMVVGLEALRYPAVVAGRVVRMSWRVLNRRTF